MAIKVGDRVWMNCTYKFQYAPKGVVEALIKTDKVWKEPTALVRFEICAPAVVRQRHLAKIPQSKAI